jgi:hypothetical protein
MKLLFSIAPKDEKGGGVAEVFLTEKQASDAGFGGVRRGHRICCLTLAALCWCVSTRRAGSRETDARRQRLVHSPWWRMLASVSDALVVLRQTHGVSVRWWWRQQSAEAAKALGNIRC